MQTLQAPNVQRLLAIESSSHVASVAILESDVLLGEFTLNHPKTHSQKLMPMLEALMAALDLKVADLDAIAVTVGPGSFTGVRIGLATAKALAQPFNLPLIPVSSLKAVAQGFQGFEGYICPIMDARKNEVYAGCYQWQNGVLVDVMAECALAPSTLIEKLKGLGQAVLLAGDGLPKYAESFKEALGQQLTISHSAHSRQRAANVADLAMASLDQAVSYDGIAAEYLRKSEAETTYESKHSKA